MNRFLTVTVLCALFVVTARPAAAQEAVRVMTRNQYLGADLGPILSAPTPAAFITAVVIALNQIAASDFPARADVLAQEIADKRPHLVGLQEVFRLTLNGQTTAAPFRDYLEDLMQALSARGQNYYIAARVQNLDVTIPIPNFGVLRAVDHDVVLVRSDVSAWPVSVPGCRISLDGCNFNTVFSFTSAVGPITLERGYVVVDAIVGNQPVRFVNTHLEIVELPPQIQAGQASELIGIINALPNPLGGPTTLVGDINSAPTDSELVLGGTTIVPPYRQFVLAGLVDAWLARPGAPAGNTCCHRSDLLNPLPNMFKRIDVIFTSVAPLEIKANIVGVDVEGRTVPAGLWPSDHAGVVAALRFGR